jgi:hypothetical protein
MSAPPTCLACYLASVQLLSLGLQTLRLAGCHIMARFGVCWSFSRASSQVIDLPNRLYLRLSTFLVAFLRLSAHLQFHSSLERPLLNCF